MIISYNESKTSAEFKIKFDNHHYTLVVDKNIQGVHLMRNSISQWNDYAEQIRGKNEQRSS